jgi:hypothetical protein
MAPARPAYLLLFLAALLLLAALSFSRGAGPPEPSRSDAPIDLHPLGQPTQAPSPSTGLHHRASRFLTAFLRYEVGDLSQPVIRGLHRSTDSRFGAELLARPPRRAPAGAAPARIGALRIALLSQRPARALLSGTAWRRGQIEQFSFLFEKSRGAWRVVGVGE